VIVLVDVIGAADIEADSVIAIDGIGGLVENLAAERELVGR